MENLLKAETTAIPTRKVFSTSIRVGLFANKRKLMSAANSECYMIILLHINRSFQNSFIQHFVAGKKGQQVWLNTDKLSKSRYAGFHKKNTACSADQDTRHLEIQKSNSENSGTVPVWRVFFLSTKN